MMGSITGTITQHGCLSIAPTTELAAYALQKWLDDNRDIVAGPDGTGNPRLIVSTTIKGPDSSE